MAKKKKKNAPPSKNQPKRKRMSVAQIIFYTLGIIVIISMILPGILTLFS